MDILTVLNTYYGLSLNEKENIWITDLIKNITVIYLDQDANIYVDKNEVYCFDFGKKLLKIARQYDKNSGRIRCPAAILC